MSTHDPISSLPGTGTVFALAERSPATFTSRPHGNLGCGLIITTMITVEDGSGTLAVTVQGQDPVSKVWYNILTGVELSAVTSVPQVLQVHPAITDLIAVAGDDEPIVNVRSALVPAVWRLSVVQGGTGDMTWSIGATATP